MQDYRIKIRLLSPTGTFWQSDTIIGHMAWQVAMDQGEGGVEEFLKPFKEGMPKFVISDGFPGDLLPKLLIPQHAEEPDDKGEYARLRKLSKAPFLKTDDFIAVCQGREMSPDMAQDDPWVYTEIPHAMLDRRTNTTSTDAGQLFFTDTWVLKEEFNNEISIYMRAEDGWAERVEDIFKNMSKSGFGRDKSVGVGAFEVIRMEPFDKFKQFENPNGFVSLSSYVPKKDDPTDGYWDIRVKRGKLAMDMAGTSNPFKHHLIQLKAGAVFKTGGSPKNYYGRAVQGIAPEYPDAVQVCYTMAVPIKFPENALKGK